MTELPVLYTFRRCPYAMRARLALAVSGLHCELREVALRNKPVAMLVASPKGTVPVLVLPSGDAIDQSLDIMRWALLQHDPQGWLNAEAINPNAAQALISHNDGPFKHHLDRYKYPNRYAGEHTGDNTAFAVTHRDKAAVWLTTLETTLSQNPWLCGATASLADMAILPFVRQFKQTDSAWFESQDFSSLSRWLVNWEAGSLFEQVMQKHPLWQADQGY